MDLGGYLCNWVKVELAPQHPDAFWANHFLYIQKAFTTYASHTKESEVE